ncbi:MAG: RHS repeat protein, partial [Bacteroidia bacterium]|nr:RHS repeat protein [Bacteroidia bacterium]
YQYTKETNAIYPLVDICVPLYVVTSVTSDNGCGNNITIIYKYTGAKFHLQGKGFMGFSQVTAIDATSRIKNINYFNFSIEDDYTEIGFDKIYYIPQNVKSENYYYHNASNSYIKMNEIIYTKKIYPYCPLDDKRIFIYDYEIYQHDYLKNTLIKTISNYINDGGIYGSGDIVYGNISSMETYYYPEPASASYDIKKINNFDNYIIANSWCPSKFTKETFTSEYANSDETSPYTRTVDYNYNSSDGLLENKINDMNTPKSVTTSYQYYNDYGVLKNITVSASGLTPRETDYEYDAKYRFITKQKNPMEHVSLAEYDAKTGNIIKSTDINNHSTSFKYDDFGRMTEKTLPTRQKITYTLHWVYYTPDAPDYSKYYSDISGDNLPDVITYYDILGREIMTIKKKFNESHQDVVIAKQYDDKGNLHSVTDTYFKDGSPTNFTYYDYNAPGYRISKIGTLTNNLLYSYDDNSITINNTSTGQVTSKSYNSAGNLINATDPGGTISYVYNNQGQVKEINYNGTITTMEYDDYGRQRFLHDPDAGTIEYLYNAYGELEYQKDARTDINNENTMTYDKLGRLLAKNCYEGVYTYVYDTVPNGIGLLSFITAPGGAAQAYKYDNLSLTSEITETIDDQTFVTKYEYDQYGNNTKIEYPSGFAIQRQFNDIGLLNNISKIETEYYIPIWNLYSVNARGQITTTSYGNNMLSEKTYDDFGYPENFKIKNFSSAQVHIIDYSFDPVWGRITSRSDNFIQNSVTYSNSETFSYDTDNKMLNRLSNVYTNNLTTPAQEIQYDANGNISMKTDAGTYTYDGAQPHAVTNVTNDLGIIPAKNQTITYNSFNKVSPIIEDTDNGIYRMEFTYGVDNERRKVVTYKDNVLLSTKYYSLNYEKEITGTTIIHDHYISGPDGLCALYRKNETTGFENMKYVHTDYLGSIIALSSEYIQDIGLRYSYDAWGRRRSPYNWNNYPPMTPFTNRGFTGHEHIDEFGLINMKTAINFFCFK